jgi:hypothetical protein
VLSDVPCATCFFRKQLDVTPAYYQVDFSPEKGVVFFGNRSGGQFAG